MNAPEEPVNGKSQQRRACNSHRPRQPAMLLVAGIEIATGPARPGLQTCVKQIARRKRAGLFKKKRKQDSKKAHGKS